MTGRELGSMMVENEVIQVIETAPAVTADERSDFFRLLGHNEFASFPVGAMTVTEWWALLLKPEERQPIAYASLSELSADAEEVAFFTIVDPRYRGYGLGKLMTRFATDQAIRFRRRSIRADVLPDCPLVGTLEDEEFERDTAERPPLITLRKKLKWQ